MPLRGLPRDRFNAGFRLAERVARSQDTPYNAMRVLVPLGVRRPERQARMTYRGTVKKGVVVLEGGVTLDEGTAVEVQPIAAPADRAPTSPGPVPTIWEKLAAMSGRVKDFPPDAARNLDHYLYDAPKSQE